MFIKKLIKKWEKLLEEYQYEEEQVRGDIEEFIKDLKECEKQVEALKAESIELKKYKQMWEKFHNENKFVRVEKKTKHCQFIMLQRLMENLEQKYFPEVKNLTSISHG